MMYMTNDKSWSRLLRPLSIVGLSLGLSISVASTAMAQGEATPPDVSDLAGSLVALHDGSCGNSLGEPEFEVGTLEVDYGYADDADAVINEGGDFDNDGTLDEDEDGYLTEDLDDDGMLDDGEDVNDNGTLDAGIDADGDGVLEDDEIFDNGDAVTPFGYATTLKAEGEIDATFEELFASDEDGDEDDLGNPGAIAIHESSENYDTILACGELVTGADWEDRGSLVIGLNPIGDSDFYAYAVFERDTGNVPVFGANTTGVTVYAFPDLDTLRNSRMMEGTPAS